METTPRPTPPARVPPVLQTAWPRSAQLTTAFLLGLATALLLVHAVGQLRWGARPTELTYRIDLNRAGRAELLQLPGVGDALAGRIETYRDEHGGFRSVDELTHVHGIGPATLERLRPCVYVRAEDGTAQRVEPERLIRKSGPTKANDPAGHKTIVRKGSNLAKPIDINRASEEELRKLPGVGPTLSRRIVEARAKGPFRAVEDLCRVPGIKQKKLEQMRPYITVEAESVRVVTTADTGDKEKPLDRR
jgi:competence protein ComEA